MSDQTNEYLKTQIRTASKEQLLVILYDGAVRFCEQARVSIREQNREETNNNLIRAQRIVMELMGSMNMEVAPDFSVKLMALYQFVNARLIEANIEKSEKKLDEALAVLRPLREAWAEATLKLRKEQGGASVINDPTAVQPRLSIKG